MRTHPTSYKLAHSEVGRWVYDAHTVHRASAPSRLHRTPFGAVYARSLSAFGVRRLRALGRWRN